ncbi:MAG: hypothetical protein M3012_07595 [Staphylococcus epidermidis]|nr:hypothetical protein [Staphylococcus epidermidis]MCT6858104.1 hypothetical protein [Apilactobacillus sp.]
MNNIDLKRKYKNNVYVSIYLDDDNSGTISFKIGDLIDEFFDSRFIGYRGIGDDKDIFINVNKILKICIHDE